MTEQAPPRRALLEDLGNAEVEQILAMKKSAIVAFVDARGFPRMLPCWFFWDGEAFYTTSDSNKPPRIKSVIESSVELLMNSDVSLATVMPRSG